MKPIVLRLVLGLLVSLGCGTVPGRDVRYEPTPMPVVRALLELAEVGPQDLSSIWDAGTGASQSQQMSLARVAWGLDGSFTGDSGASERA